MTRPQTQAAQPTTACGLPSAFPSPAGNASPLLPSVRPLLGRAKRCSLTVQGWRRSCFISLADDSLLLIAGTTLSPSLPLAATASTASAQASCTWMPSASATSLAECQLNATVGAVTFLGMGNSAACTSALCQGSPYKSAASVNTSRAAVASSTVGSRLRVLRNNF